VENPGAHLACYKIKPNKLAAPVHVQMVDALGGGQRELKKSNLLCVPAAATVAAGRLERQSAGAVLQRRRSAGGHLGLASRSQHTADRAALNAYDLVLMQETWQTPDPNPFAPTRVYHEILVAGSQHPYKSVSRRTRSTWIPSGRTRFWATA
jgi:hypothetical protein